MLQEPSHLKIGIIVQARFDSSRFPGKALIKLWKDETTISFLLKRLLSLKSIANQQLILATSSTEDCDFLEELCREIGIYCFRGEKHNVYSRFLQCSHEFSLDVIVRITGDCILQCPKLVQSFIDKWSVVNMFAQNNFILTNKYPFSYCDGFDIEVFSSELLESYCIKVDTVKSLQEHVTTCFYADERIKKINIMSEDPRHFPKVRLVLDYPSDLKAIKLIIQDFTEYNPSRSPLHQMFYSDITSLKLFKNWLIHPKNAPNHEYLASDSTLFI